MLAREAPFRRATDKAGDRHSGRADSRSSKDAEKRLQIWDNSPPSRGATHKQKLVEGKKNEDKRSREYAGSRIEM